MARGPGKKARRNYICEWQKCGKANCTKCPHGPYWYERIRVRGRLRRRYIGKNGPGPDVAPDSG